MPVATKTRMGTRGRPEQSRAAILKAAVREFAQEGVAGARMTGGGFGGCTVNLVRRDVLDGFRESVARAYEIATGIMPAIYIVEADAGVCEHTDIVRIEESVTR